MSLIYKNADGCYCDIAGSTSKNVNATTAACNTSLVGTGDNGVSLCYTTGHNISMDPGSGRLYSDGGYSTDGTNVLFVRNGNNLDISPTNGCNSAWLNYRGGVCQLLIGSGAGNGNLGQIVTRLTNADAIANTGDPNMSISSNCNLNICACNNLNANADIIRIQSDTETNILSGSDVLNTRGTITLQADSFTANCAPIIQFVNHCSGSYYGSHLIRGNEKLTKVCYQGSTQVEYPYALVCDLGGLNSDITAFVASDTSFYSALTTATNAATLWESFSGSTMNGYGGAWFGYKRPGSATAMIIWHEMLIKGLYDENNNVWSLKSIL